MTDKPTESAPAVRASPNMLPCDARALLMSCRHSHQALQDAAVAIETGRIACEIQAVIYPNTPSRHRGTKAKLKAAHWNRIVSEGQEEVFWSSARADLPATADAQAVELRGVRLNEADLRLFAAEYGLADSNGSPVAETAVLPNVRRKKNATGRPPKYEAWEEFWMAVVKLAKVGELNEDGFHTQAELVNHLLDEIGMKLSKDSIEPKVSMIWRAFVRPLPKMD